MRIGNAQELVRALLDGKVSDYQITDQHLDDDGTLHVRVAYLVATPPEYIVVNIEQVDDAGR